MEECSFVWYIYLIPVHLWCFLYEMLDLIVYLIFHHGSYTVYVEIAFCSPEANTLVGSMQ